jgi:hypothetical protein
MKQKKRNSDELQNKLILIHEVYFFPFYIVHFIFGE